MSHKKVGLKAETKVLPEPRVIIADEEDDNDDELIEEDEEEEREESDREESDDDSTELSKLAEAEFARIDAENNVRVVDTQPKQSASSKMDIMSKPIPKANLAVSTPVVNENNAPMPMASKRKPRTKKTYPPSDTMYDQLIKAVSEQRDATRKVMTLIRETQKCTSNELKGLRALVKKQKGDKPRRKPRGFALPSLISQEMVDYLLNETKISYVDRKIEGQVIGQIKIETGCTLARNELTAALCQHFVNRGMRKNEQDKRKIYLDQATVILFGIDKDQFIKDGGQLSANGEVIITYFELQKYLPRHCGKKAVGH